MTNMFKKVLLSTILLVGLLFLQACGVQYHTYVPAQYEYPELATAPEGGVEGLTNYLIKNYKNDEDKVKIIYLWILQNVDSNSSQKSSSDWEDIYYSNRGIANSKSYSDLFAKMLNIAGIKNEVIAGTSINNTSKQEMKTNSTFRSNISSQLHDISNAKTKKDNAIRAQYDNIHKLCSQMGSACTVDKHSDLIWYSSRSEHTEELKGMFDEVAKMKKQDPLSFVNATFSYWNVVFLDGKPYMFDLMLSDKDTEGYNYDYYKVSPENFTYDHFPVEEKYQYRLPPLWINDFITQYEN